MSSKKADLSSSWNAGQLSELTLEAGLSEVAEVLWSDELSPVAKSESDPDIKELAPQHAASAEYQDAKSDGHFINFCKWSKQKWKK